MMVNRFRFFSGVLIFIFLFFSFSGFSQQKKGIEYSGFFDSYYFRGPLNITVAGGLSTVNGDICRLFDCNSFYSSLGFSYQVWPRTYFGAEFSYVNLAGARSDSLNYSFTNTGIQTDLFIRFLLLDKTVTRHGQLKEKPYLIRPYIMTGVGLFYSMGQSASYNLAFDTLGSFPGYSFQPFVFNIPAGIGFQIWFSHRFSVMPEFTYRFAYTDGLDGVSLATDKSGIDAFATLGLKLQFTPTAPRVRKKKKKLEPPTEYTGPKGTDYPKKREETKPKRFGPPLPDYEPQEGGDGDWGGEDQDPALDQDPNQESDPNQQPPAEDGWDTGGDEGQPQEQPQEQNQQQDDWGW